MQFQTFGKVSFAEFSRPPLILPPRPCYDARNHSSLGCGHIDGVRARKINRVRQDQFCALNQRIKTVSHRQSIRENERPISRAVAILRAGSIAQAA